MFVSKQTSPERQILNVNRFSAALWEEKETIFHIYLKLKKKTKLLSQFDLKEVIRQTIFSVSDNENNKLMTGELLSIENNKMTVTSLDGHRISVRNIELQESYPKMEVIVP